MFCISYIRVKSKA